MRHAESAGIRPGVIRWRLSALLLGLVVLCPVGALSAPWIGAGMEYFSLSERADGETLLTEQGSRFVLLGGYDWQGTHWQAAWRGRFGTGNVSYDGRTHTGQPLRTTTAWNSTTQELRLGTVPYRIGRLALGAQAGLGFMAARRSISNLARGNQDEDFFMGVLRLGIDARQGRLSMQAGLLHPWAVRQDAHLQELGFAENPLLHPRPRPAFWLQAGWRLSSGNRIEIGYEGLRLEASPPVQVRALQSVGHCLAGSLCTVYQPDTRIDRLWLSLHHRF